MVHRHSKMLGCRQSRIAPKRSCSWIPVEGIRTCRCWRAGGPRRHRVRRDSSGCGHACNQVESQLRTSRAGRSNPKRTFNQYLHAPDSPQQTRHTPEMTGKHVGRRQARRTTCKPVSSHKGTRHRMLQLSPPRQRQPQAMPTPGSEPYKQSTERAGRRSVLGSKARRTCTSVLATLAGPCCSAPSISLRLRPEAGPATGVVACLGSGKTRCTPGNDQDN